MLSQETRGALRVAAGADPPLDQHVDDLRKSPQALCFMTPLPSAGQTAGGPKPNAPPAPDNRGPKRALPEGPRGAGPHGSDKNKFRKTGEPGGKTVKDLLQSMPSNCISKTDAGKLICLHYNNGTCRKQKSSSCNMGIHMCYYKGCGKKRPYIECSH